MPSQAAQNEARNFYISTLGREPENAEVLNSWASYIDNVGFEGARDAFNTAAAPELDARSDQIAASLYQDILGREPESQAVVDSWSDYVETVGVAGAKNAFLQAAGPELYANAQAGVEASPSDIYGNVLTKGSTLTGEKFQPYKGDRFAPQTDLEKYILQQLQEQKASSLASINAAQAEYDRLLGALEDLKYNANKVTTGLGDVKSIQDYVNPYTQETIDTALRMLDENAARAQAKEAAQLARMGGLGGSGRYIMEAERQKALEQSKADTQSQGLQAAYDFAQKQRLAESQLSLEAQKISEQSNQFAAQIARDLAAQRLTAAQGMGNLANIEATYGLGLLDRQMKAAEAERARQQAPYDFGFQQWQASQAYPYQQLEFMKGLLNIPTMYYPQPTGSDPFAAFLQGAATGYTATPKP